MFGTKKIEYEMHVVGIRPLRILCMCTVVNVGKPNKCHFIYFSHLHIDLKYIRFSKLAF